MGNLTLKHFLFITVMTLTGMIMSCQAPSDKKVSEPEIEQAVKNVYNTESPATMLIAVAEACGGFEKLKALNDVEYDYHYMAPDGKSDISKERYIFENEISWAKYSTHQINVSPDLEGDIVQFYNGQSAKVYHNGEALDDPSIVGTGQFLRQANYMWFNMMFKLTDPGIIYKYEGQEEIEGKTYDVLLVTYDPVVVGKEVNDTYILYINPETQMVESFKFSLPAFGVEQPVLHAQLTYEQIDGIEVITRRVMTSPSPDGDGMVPMVDQQIKNVKFNNGFTAEDLGKDI